MLKHEQWDLWARAKRHDCPVYPARLMCPTARRVQAGQQPPQRRLRFPAPKGHAAVQFDFSSQAYRVMHSKNGWVDDQRLATKYLSHYLEWQGAMAKGAAGRALPDRSLA